MNLLVLSKKVVLTALVISLLWSNQLPKPAKAEIAKEFSTSVITSQLSVPVAIQFDSTGRIFVAEKSGTLKIVLTDGSIKTLGSISVNSDYEQGLLGMVLDPNFSTNGYLYLAYTRPDGNFNRVSRFTATGIGLDQLASGSETILLDNIPSPTGIHQVGELQIGNDGKLYIPSGDGAIDAQNPQLLSSLSGKILRINLDGSIPEDNPFVGQVDNRPEIWAYGVRNPFTSGVQKSTGRIFINDVGKDNWEEINDLKKGENYGWTACEGVCSPARPGFTDPFYTYNHYSGSVTGRSITGGAWYEGTVYPADYTGSYLFADYVRGWVKKINLQTKEVTEVMTGLLGVVNLKIGPDGLLYVVQLDVTTGSGSIKCLNYGTSTAPATNTVTVYAAGTSAAGV